MKPFKNIIMKKGLCWCGSGKPYGDCHKEFDEVLKVYKKQGCEIPSRDMIKNEEQIAGIREAGRINTLILDAVANEIHAGMTTEDIDRIVVRETKKYGGKSACLNYEGNSK